MITTPFPTRSLHSLPVPSRSFQPRSDSSCRSLFTDYNLCSWRDFACGFFFFDGEIPLQRKVDSVPSHIPLPSQYEFSSCWRPKLSYASCAVHRPPLLIIFVLCAGLAPQVHSALLATVKFVSSLPVRRIYIFHQNHIHLWFNKACMLYLFTLIALYRWYKEKTCLDHFPEGCTAYNYHSTTEVNDRYN